MSRLAPELEAGSQAIRQLRRENALLGLLDVVGYAVKRDAGQRSAIVFIQGESRPPVAIARLSDGAGVNEVALARSEPHGRGDRTFHAVVNRAEGPRFAAFPNEATLDVGMAEEDQRRVARQFEIVVGRSRVEQVLVFIQRRAVHELHPGKLLPERSEE